MNRLPPPTDYVPTAASPPFASPPRFRAAAATPSSTRASTATPPTLPRRSTTERTGARPSTSRRFSNREREREREGENNCHKESHTAPQDLLPLTSSSSVLLFTCGRFNPVLYNATEWASLFKDAGAQYEEKRRGERNNTLCAVCGVRCAKCCVVLCGGTVW